MDRRLPGIRRNEVRRICGASDSKEASPPRIQTIEVDGRRTRHDAVEIIGKFLCVANTLSAAQRTS